VTWTQVAQSIQSALHRKFRRRLRWAQWLHAVLLSTAGRAALRSLAGCGLLPWRWLYQKVR
jgi:hypothetical protein